MLADLQRFRRCGQLEDGQDPRQGKELTESVDGCEPADEEDQSEQEGVVGNPRFMTVSSFDRLRSGQTHKA